MNDPQWERIQAGGRERWNLVEWRAYNAAQRGMYRHYIGYIIKIKNKHRCRAWYVHFVENRWVGDSQYLGRLTDMKHDEAKAAAKLLILAQRSKT